MRILYVDDEPDIRDIACFALALDKDFEVTSAESGFEALSLARSWRPDIILLDVMMPVMDGPSTLAHLRADGSVLVIPVVFITARAQALEVETFKRLGAAGVIAKPFDPMTLASQVRVFMRSDPKASISERE